ncbi:CorA family divalent cation transporter [Thalassotalea aquiviva]|uniref:CorA family divalent cation transporter n=1 Tax=Thalassotalea aquiviva TaxID=3242415 RepID=UPI00352B093E
MQDPIIESRQTLGQQEQEFSWLNVVIEQHEAVSETTSLAIPIAAQEGLLADETRPRCIKIDDGLLICLRAINFNRPAEPDDMVSLRIWMSKNLVISATKSGRGLKSINELQHELHKGLVLRNAGEWFCALLEKVTSKISEQLDEIETRVEQLEEQLNSDPDSVNRLEILEIRKQAAQIKRFIAPQREALDVFHYYCDFIDEVQSFRIKEQTDRILRYIDSLDVVREKSILILDELRYAIAEKQSERMYVLSLVTAIFLPLSFLTGVFGMNVGGLPGVDNNDFFVHLMVAMLGVGLFILLLMKWKKWL